MKLALPAGILCMSLVLGAIAAGITASAPRQATQPTAQYDADAAAGQRTVSGDLDAGDSAVLDRLYIQSGPFALPGRDG